jgi:hypothetical protein
MIDNESVVQAVIDAVKIGYGHTAMTTILE